jgi:uncharacterized protein YcaQ
MTRASAALRRHAAARTLFAPRDLAAAIGLLGFVQIDPLRAPARAQELILRQRVPGYRAGELDRAFQAGGLIEDFVHVHGVLPAASRRLLHPRSIERTWRVEREHPKLAAQIVDFIARNGPTHPRDLTRAFGRTSVVNGWGGHSAATTRLLELLHYRGTLEIAGRDGNIRLYRIAPPPARVLAPRARFAGVAELLVRIYAPLPVASLRELMRMAADEAFDAAARERLLARFLARDSIARTTLDGVTYVWPADEAAPGAEPDDTVRFVAPFDPLVWDRRRFEHLHGWDYRFEAYTPAARRRFGYYALPLIWRDRAVGWVNVVRAGKSLDVRTGFVGAQPRGRPFARAFEAEVARMTAFLATVPADGP